MKKIFLILTTLIAIFGISKVNAQSLYIDKRPNACFKDSNTITCNQQVIGGSAFYVFTTNNIQKATFQYTSFGTSASQYDYITWQYYISSTSTQDTVQNSITASFGGVECNVISNSNTHISIVCPYKDSGYLDIFNRFKYGNNTTYGISQNVGFYSKNDYLLQQILNSLNTQNGNFDTLHRDNTTINNNITNVNDNITNLNNTLNDTNLDSNTISNATNIGNLGQTSTSNGALNLIMLPVNFLSSIISSFGNTCASFDLGTLWGVNISLPCINLRGLLGQGLYNLIDIFMFFGIFFAFIKSVIKFIRKTILLTYDASSEVGLL